MQTSQEVRQKLVTVIGNLICRCIEDASKIPYVLSQEQVMEILVRDPVYFAELVRNEHYDRTVFSSDRLTAKLDAVAELGQMEALDAFDLSFSGGLAAAADLDPVLDLINQLTRTFMVYTGNTVTIFDKEFQLFMEKLRQSLLESGMALQATSLTDADLAELEAKARGYIDAGQFLQAFLFIRMLHTDVIMRELVKLPVSAGAHTRQFLRSILREEALRPGLVTFILRVSYVSQGAWQDLFDLLVQMTEIEPDLCPRSMLADKIEQDGIFCCNLLCESFTDLAKWPSAERRAAIGMRLECGSGKSHES